MSFLAATVTAPTTHTICNPLVLFLYSFLRKSYTYFFFIRSFAYLPHSLFRTFFFIVVVITLHLYRIVLCVYTVFFLLFLSYFHSVQLVLVFYFMRSLQTITAEPFLHANNKCELRMLRRETVRLEQ